MVVVSLVDGCMMPSLRMCLSLLSLAGWRSKIVYGMVGLFVVRRQLLNQKRYYVVLDTGNKLDRTTVSRNNWPTMTLGSVNWHCGSARVFHHCDSGSVPAP